MADLATRVADLESQLAEIQKSLKIAPPKRNKEEIEGSIPGENATVKPNSK